MILTGKAKEDFIEWYNENVGKKISVGHLSFFTLSETMINATIIDFFDSVDIHINCPPYYDKYLKYNRGFECFVIDQKGNSHYDIDNDNDVFNSREEATKKAIEKANKTYNKL